MARILVFFSLLFAITGCRNNLSPSTDPQQNRYFRIYNEIYTGWGQISIDSTQQKLNAYLQEFPENAEAQMMAGNIAYSLKDYEKATSYYRTAIAIKPGQPLFYSALASVFNVQEQTDSAEKYLLKAISLHDSSAFTFMNAAHVYLKKNEKEKSLAFADSAYAKGGSLPLICSSLCFVFDRWNEKPKSREFYDRAVALGLKDTAAFKNVLDGKLKLTDYYQTNYPY